MRRSLLWIITLSLPIAFLGLLAYLLKDSVLPLDWSQLKASDLINLGALAIGFFGAFVAIGSLFVAVSQLQQAAKDGEEQRQSLDASRAQLQAVVETAKQQQEVLTQHLETSKAQLALQQEFQRQEKERASRKPKLHVFIDDNSFDPEKMTTGLAVDKDKRTRLPIRNRNIGSAPLHKPIFLAVASRKEVQRGSQWVLFCTPS